MANTSNARENPEGRNRNNHRYEVEEGPERDRGRNNPNRENLPIPRRHIAYEEELSDDEEYAETQLGRNRVAAFPVSSYEQSSGGPSKGKAPMNPPPPNYTPRGTGHNRLPTNTAGAAVTEAPRNPYSRPSSDKCYRCGQPGHRSNQCPKRGTVNLIGAEEEADLESEGVEDETAYDYDENEVTEGDDGERLSHALVIRKLLLTPKQKEKT
ncbi:hypothetical protein DKX38_006145 [Salix brachista]|uniref:CCHC-type domain-containing protein n=1 Tax=Salix brachista TaxID=2182728 RepID=A0A5N5N2G0_9ROSI|nr:hypothetical protein DKX38_006145 [Salix brachista]